MAYDKHTWTCNEPITVERLNHIEDGIANAGGDCGYECEEEWVTLTEESVTTTVQSGYNFAELSYSQFIDAETIRVTFDGVEYDCPRMVLESNQNCYGGFDPMTGTPDFSQYPFVIVSIDGSGNEIATETAGTHAIKIETVEETVTTTPCFDLARGYSCSETVEVLDDETVITVYDDKGGYNRGSINLTLSEPIPQLTITFDNVKYECEMNDDYTYGSTSYTTFSEYPFRIYMDGKIYTSTPGEHSVKVEQVETFATTTPCFEKAVQSIASPLVVKASCAPSEGTSNVPSTLDASPSEICDAMKTRGVVVEDPYGNLYSVLYATNGDVTIISSEYDSTATPPTVLHPYMYAYDNVLRYPPTIFH